MRDANFIREGLPTQPYRPCPGGGTGPQLEPTGRRLSDLKKLVRFTIFELLLETYRTASPLGTLVTTGVGLQGLSSNSSEFFLKLAEKFATQGALPAMLGIHPEPDPDRIRLQILLFSHNNFSHNNFSQNNSC